MATDTWTESKVHELSRLAAQGKSASKIAAVLGVTRNSVIGVCYRRGITLSGSGRYAAKLTENDAREIISRKANGESAASLASRFGVHWVYVYRICKGDAPKWRHLVAERAA